MQLLLKLGAGVLARFIGLLADHFAQWLFHEVSEGADAAATDSLSQFLEFGQWFIKTLAAQLCGRPRHHFDGYEDEYQPGFFGSR